MSCFLVISSTDILFLLFILIICIRHDLLPNFDGEFLRRSYMNARNLLNIQKKGGKNIKDGEKLVGIRRRYRYEGSESEEEEGSGVVECAVCLSDIKEGDEIRELQCDHLFHRVCLDKWAIEYAHLSCPLCRTSLSKSSSTRNRNRNRNRVAAGNSELGVQVLFFNFCNSSRNSTQRTSWGLR